MSAWRKGTAEPRAEFHCRMCAAVAMVVCRRDSGVAITGFLGSNWLALSGIRRPVGKGELERALEASDAGALHDLHPEFAPAWCPQCRATYCRAHWIVMVAGADDHAGWYDATYGVCPEGHERKLDD